MAPSLVELAGRFGIATDYDDWSGRRVGVPESTLIAVLAALGVPAADEAERNAARIAHERGALVARPAADHPEPAGTQTTFWVHVTHGQPAEVWLQLEDGSVRTGIRQVDNFTPPFDLDGRWIGEASFELPDVLPLGYHRLHLRSGDDETSTALIVTPAWLGLPERLGARRTWGLATQLYSVRSASPGVSATSPISPTWPSGRRSGTAPVIVLVNPLHAAEPTAPMEPSPYLPTSRRFANPLYLRVEAIPEYADLRHAAGCGGCATTLQHRAAALDSIDRDAAWTAKRAALKLVYPGSANGRPRAGVRGLPRPRGRGARRLRHLVRAGRGVRRRLARVARVGCSIPAPPASPSSPPSIGAPSTSIGGCSGCWTSNSPPRSRRRAAGMALGIMHDLAVGVHPDGADSWALQDVLALGVSVGAPPDEFNQPGQDWSQPPWRPDRLAELEYAPFRALVRSVLRHAGGVRVDHIIGLFRLWWIPKGEAAHRGHLRPLRPRGDDRHPRAGGAPRRARGGRRGSGHR